MQRVYSGFLLVLVAAILPSGTAKTAAEWRNRVIYQILTDRFAHNTTDPPTKCTDLRGWCGGTFKGIQRRLDYITGLGADAIWISPMVLNTPGGYHGYWAKDIFEVEPHFGTKQDLIELINECHNRNVWVMLDVVPNHMGYPAGCDWNPCNDSKLLNFTGFTPFDQAEHYHSFCRIHDYNDQQQVELCRLAQLPDLNQTVSYVNETLMDWIANATRDYGFDGYRVDTARHIKKSFWPSYQSKAGAFLIGEISGDVTKSAYVGDYQNYMDSVLNFPMYWAMRHVFNEGRDMTLLAENLREQRGNFSDVSVAGLFADNHDMHRFLNLTRDTAMFKNALAYILLGQGIPIIYYGSEQEFHGGGDPDNRESLWPHGDPNSSMYKWIKSVIEHRKENSTFGKHIQTELQVTKKGFVFSRGSNNETLVFLTNGGSAHTETFSVRLPMNGAEYTNIFLSTDKVTVAGCTFQTSLTNGEPRIYKLTKDKTPGPGCSAALGVHGGGVLALALFLISLTFYM